MPHAMHLWLRLPLSPYARHQGVECDLSHLANYSILDYGLETLFFSFFGSTNDYFVALLVDRLFPRLAITDIRSRYGLD